MSGVTTFISILAIISVILGLLSYGVYGITQWMLKRRYKEEDDKSRRQNREPNTAASTVISTGV